MQQIVAFVQHAHAYVDAFFQIISDAGKQLRNYWSKFLLSTECSEPDATCKQRSAKSKEYLASTGRPPRYVMVIDMQLIFAWFIAGWFFLLLLLLAR